MILQMEALLDALVPHQASKQQIGLSLEFLLRRASLEIALLFRRYASL